MSNAARKDRKRKGEKFQKAAKVPTYSVGLSKPKHSATPYQIAKAVDRALAAAAKPSKADPELIAEGNRAHDEAEEWAEAPEPTCPSCGAVGEEPCLTRAGKVASKPHAGR